MRLALMVFHAAQEQCRAIIQVAAGLKTVLTLYGQLSRVRMGFSLERVSRPGLPDCGFFLFINFPLAVRVRSTSPSGPMWPYFQ